MFNEQCNSGTSLSDHMLAVPQGLEFKSYQVKPQNAAYSTKIATNTVYII